MTRSSIDFGIDLGTTNSALAVMQQGLPLVVMNNESQPLTPSVVRIDKAGTLTVGKRAYDRLDDAGNTVGEFKRWMGSSEEFAFSAAARSLSAPALSAEVLKVLRASAQHQLQEPCDSAVITVPAAFDLDQCAATVDAAKLAGILHAPLLQEPIAASLAYGYRVDLEGKHWLVYDLGGGTFDLALVGVREGRITVIDHEGDNHLGGKDFDWMFVEKLVLPLLAERYDVRSFKRANPLRRSDLARLKAKVEDAKKELSREESAIVSLESFGRPILDDRGAEIDIDLAISRPRYEEAIRTLVERSVSLSRQLLTRNRAAYPDAVLMVGGPTVTPFVRTSISDGLSLRVDTTANPMTVVAEGAALYAGAQPTPRRDVASFAPPTLVSTIQLDYRSVTDEDSVLIGGRVDDAETIEFTASDGSWASGQLSLRDERFVSRLPLPRRGPHRFKVRVVDAQGNVRNVQPTEITISRGLTATAAPLAKRIGIVVEEGAGSRVKSVVARGTPLPARYTHEFRSTVALEPGDEAEIITIHLVEGESDRPERNKNVGQLIITSREVGRRVPVGNPLQVTIEVDESRLLRASAYLPLLDKSFDVEVRLGTASPDDEDMTAAVIGERERVEGLSPHISSGTARQLYEELREVEAKMAIARAGDSDSASAAQSELRTVQVRIDEMERAQEIPRAVSAAREESEMASTIVMEYGDEGHRARLAALIRDLDQAVAQNSVREIRRATEKLNRLRFELLTQQLSFWIGYFNYLIETVQGWTDAAVADTLQRKGRNQVIQEDRNGLRQTVIALLDLVRGNERTQAITYNNVGITL